MTHLPRGEDDLSAIVTTGLGKRYGTVEALSDLDLCVPRGVIYGFLGPNGAGKTTTIRLLMGFVKPSAGSARVLGHDAWTDGVAARRNLGYLVGAESLYPDMIGEAQLDYAARLTGRPPVLRRRLLDALELSDDALGRRLGAYSKGMRQKLALVAAIQHDPALLVLDEPTDGLDPLIQRSFEELLRELRDRGRTIFMSSHDLAEVERTCSRVAVVRGGRLVAEETIEGLKRLHRRTAEVTFASGVPVELEAVPAVSLLTRAGARARLSVEGDVNPLLRFLATRDVTDLTLAPPSLDDIFMGFYGEGSTDAAANGHVAGHGDLIGNGRVGDAQGAGVGSGAIHEPRAVPEPPPQAAVLDPRTPVGAEAGAACQRGEAGERNDLALVGRMTGRLLGRGVAGFLALLLGVALFELIQPVVADSLGGPAGLEPFLRALPPALQALTRTRPEFIAVSGLAGYLSLGFTHPLYLVLAATTIIGFACRGLAGEMERGTIQLPLSRAVSRARVYGARVVGLVIVSLALALVGPLGMMAGMAVARPEGDFAYEHFVPTGIATALLFWAIGGLTLLGSAAASTTGRAVAWATAGLIVFYFVDYFASLWAILEPVEPLSIFDYYDPSRALVNGSLPWINVATLGAVGVAGALAGLVVFVRRDLPSPA